MVGQAPECYPIGFPAGSRTADRQSLSVRTVLWLRIRKSAHICAENLTSFCIFVDSRCEFTFFSNFVPNFSNFFKFICEMTENEAHKLLYIFVFCRFSLKYTFNIVYVFCLSFQRNISRGYWNVCLQFSLPSTKLNDFILFFYFPFH